MADKTPLKDDEKKIIDSSGNELSIDSSGKAKVVIEDSVSTNATIQNTTLDIKLKDSAGTNTAAINSLGEMSVAIQNQPVVSVTGTTTVSGTVSSNATIQNASIAVTNSDIGKTVYSESDISGMASSTLRKFISAYRDGHLSKFVNNSYDSNSGLASISTFQFPEVTSTTAKALKRSRTFESSSPYQIKTETFSLVDWDTNEEIVAPTPTISLGTISHPANDSSTQGTDVCTVTIANLGLDTTCTVALSGADASYYQLNNGVNTSASSVTFTTGQTLLIETSASTFPDGYTHAVTVTVTANNGKTNTATLNTTQEANAVLGFSNTKYIKALNYSSNTASYKQHLRTNQHPWGDNNMDAMANWSLSFWMKWEGSTTETNDDGHGWIVSTINDEDATKSGWVFLVTSAGDLMWYFANSSGSIVSGPKYNNIRDTLTDGNWHHVVFTHKIASSDSFAISSSSSYHKLWVDGVVQTPSTALSAVNISYGSNNPVTFGNHPHYARQNTTRSADISIDEITFWDVDLASDISGSSSATITAMYNNGAPRDESSETGLLEYYRADTSGDTVTGSSSYIKCAKHPSSTDHKLIPYYHDSSNVRQQGWTYTTNNNGISSLATSESIYVSGSSFTNAKYLDISSTANTQTFKIGTVAQFDNDSDGFAFRRRQDEWTISFWMKVASGEWNTDSFYANAKTIFSNGCTGSWAGLFAHQRDGNLWIYYGKNGAHVGYIIFNASGWDDGNWHHYAVTYDGPEMVNDSSDLPAALIANLKVYRDGSVVTATNAYSDGGGSWFDAISEISFDTGSAGEFRFGYPNYTGHPAAVASYDEIAIWKKVLTSTQINSIYNSGTANDVSSIEASDLKRYYRFENSDGTDTAGNHTGTKGTGPTYEDY